MPEPGGAAGPPSVEEIQQAMRAIATVCPAEARPILTVLLGNLLSASQAGGIVQSKLEGLDVSLRKHLRQVWLDGVVVPLVRTRNELQRATFSAMPVLRDPRDVSDVLAAVRRIASEVPELTTAQEHLAKAVRYLEAVPVLMRAMADLEGRTFRMGAGRWRASGYGSGERDTARRRQVRSAEQAFRRAARNALAPLARDLTDAVFACTLAAANGPPFTRTAPELLAPPVGGLRARSREVPAWRLRVIEGLQADLWNGGLGAALEALLRRHPGIEVRGVGVTREGDVSGLARISLARGSIKFALTARFDLQVGSLEQDAADLVVAGRRTPRASRAELEACLDRLLPPEFDTGPFRLMHRILDGDGGEDLALDPYGEDELVIACAAGGRVPPDFVGWLVEAADEEGVALKVASDETGLLIGELARHGFAWADGKERRFMTRPASPPWAAGTAP
ncbi:hypothetical protein [Methylobacterium durans]|uniref:Uncharacterized protein n=1 Tax=Methylobacterium durans TaxID=2202825 RepID=A0A2U8WA81_9HYPH|nr:hypothetical protein [Methylobacterium durans]AWN42518.1 hypothetical protein DK389_20955 [Methylobacterium durans]